jgi:hypothetical protein
MKKTADRFTTQAPTIEEKVKHLDNKVHDLLTKVHLRELSLERTTKANEDYKSQNIRLTKKLGSKLPSPLLPSPCILCNMLLTSLQLTETNAELNTLKAMVENIVAFFYPSDPSSAARASELLDGLLTRCREVILPNMK